MFYEAAGELVRPGLDSGLVFFDLPDDVGDDVRMFSRDIVTFRGICLQIEEEGRIVEFILDA